MISFQLVTKGYHTLTGKMFGLTVIKVDIHSETMSGNIKYVSDSMSELS